MLGDCHPMNSQILIFGWDADRFEWESANFEGEQQGTLAFQNQRNILVSYGLMGLVGSVDGVPN